GDVGRWRAGGGGEGEWEVRWRGKGGMRGQEQQRQRVVLLARQALVAGGRYHELVGGHVRCHSFLATPPSLNAAHLVCQAANGDGDQPASRILRDALLVPLHRSGEQC